MNSGFVQVGVALNDDTGDRFVMIRMADEDGPDTTTMALTADDARQLADDIRAAANSADALDAARDIIDGAS